MRGYSPAYEAPEKGTLTRMEYGDLLRLVIRWAFGLETASSSMTQVSTVSQRSEDLKGGTKPSSPPPGADVQQSSEQPLPIESSLVEKVRTEACYLKTVILDYIFTRLQNS